MALIWLSLALHLLGERPAAVKLARPRRRAARWRARRVLCRAAERSSLRWPLRSISLAAKLFWVHMTQHVLLLGVAAPLIVLGAPWISIWRPLPLRWRRRIAVTVVSSRRLATAAGRRLDWSARPGPAWVVVHRQPDLLARAVRLRPDPAQLGVHALEHPRSCCSACCCGCRCFDSPPLRCGSPRSTACSTSSARTAIGWVLSLVLAFAAQPSCIRRTPHLATVPAGSPRWPTSSSPAGMMLGPGSLAATLFVFIGLYRWLGTGSETEAIRCSHG